MNLRNFVNLRTLVILSLVVALTGCLPRGETISLDAVLQNAKLEFSDALEGGLQPEVKAQLEDSSKLLLSLLEVPSAVSARHSASQLADTLTVLRNKAGYTSRPSLGELAEEFRRIALTRESEEITPGRVKLLVARTLGLFASELQTTRFAL